MKPLFAEEVRLTQRKAGHEQPTVQKTHKRAGRAIAEGKRFFELLIAQPATSDGWRQGLKSLRPPSEQRKKDLNSCLLPSALATCTIHQSSTLSFQGAASGFVGSNRGDAGRQDKSPLGPRRSLELRTG
jgi:hypothetical protein